METAERVPGNVGVLEEGMPRKGLCSLLKLRGPDTLGRAIHVQVTALCNLPWEVCLGQLPEVHALADVLCPPRHVFLQLFTVVPSKHSSVKDIGDPSIVLQNAKDVSRVLDGLGTSEVECLNFQIWPACSSTSDEGAAHYFRTSVKKQGFDGLVLVVSVYPAVNLGWRQKLTEWRRPMPSGA